MDWKAATRETLRYWRELRRSMGRMDEVELLREINAVNDLCLKAREESAGQSGRCRSCIAFQQFGGCLGASLEMSERAVDGDLEGLGRLMDGFIARLESLEIPPEA